MAATNKVWLNNNPPSCEDSDLNGFKSENNNLIQGSGQSLNIGDNQQTHKAVAAYSAVGDFFTGGGIADAYTVTAPSPRINPPSRMNGMVIRFIVPVTNTGACTLNAFGTGASDIRLSDGVTNPAAGDLTAGEEVTVIDRGSYFEIATLASLADFSSNSNSVSFPKNLVYQWVTVTQTAGGSGDSTYTAPWPTPFTTLLHSSPTVQAVSGDGRIYAARENGLSTTTNAVAVVYNGAPTQDITIKWMGVGIID